jgi:hypothetical protein
VRKLIQGILISLLVFGVTLFLTPILTKTPGDQFVFLVSFPLVSFIPLFKTKYGDDNLMLAMSGVVIGNTIAGMIGLYNLLGVWWFIGAWKWFLSGAAIFFCAGSIVMYFRRKPDVHKALPYKTETLGKGWVSIAPLLSFLVSFYVISHKFPFRD